MTTTVPQNMKGSNIMGSHLPTRQSLRHSRMLVGKNNFPSETRFRVTIQSIWVFEVFQYIDSPHSQYVKSSRICNLYSSYAAQKSTRNTPSESSKIFVQFSYSGWFSDIMPRVMVMLVGSKY